MATRGRHEAGRSTQVGRPRTPRWRPLVATAIVGSLLVGACTSDDASPGTTTGATTSPTDPSTTDGPVTTNGNGQGDGNGSGSGGALRNVSTLRLSEGTSQAGPATPVALVSGAALDPDAIAAVLARLPEWVDDTSLAEVFSWPTQTLQRPLAGITIDTPFPDPDQTHAPDAPAVPTGPLHVLRSQPEGDIALAPFFSLTFDQPMVPVATVGQLATLDVPATLTPEVPGSWQWIGTRTLRFDAATGDRLPMATEFVVEVPAGTTSTTGGALAEAYRFEFATPPVTVQSFQPTGDSLPLSPVFVATFDQTVDPQAVLANVSLTADGDERSVRLATADEIDADDLARALVGQTAEGQVLAFVPAEPLPADAAVVATFAAGTPSAEGPRTTTDDEAFDARTYAPLSILRSECGYGSPCPPSTSLEITMNNELDGASFDPSSIVVDPPLAGMQVGAYGSGISITGATLGRTTYRVTLPASLTDVFGQQLGESTSVEITIGSASPVLQPFNRSITTLDPLAAGSAIPVVSVNHDRLRVRVFAVGLDDWTAFQTYWLEGLQYGDRTAEVPDWQVLSDTEVDTGGEPDRITETTIDLADALGGAGQVVVLVEPTERYTQDDPDYWTNRPTATWVQATTLGIDVVADTQELRAWVTDLATGAPVEGVTVTQVGLDPTATTNEDGLATLALGAAGTTAVIARRGDEAALLPAGEYGPSLAAYPTADEARWYVIDDRGVYRPGETVSIKGLVRRFTGASDGQIELLDSDVQVVWSATDSQGNSIATDVVDVSPLGGFDFQIDLPEGANTGYAYVNIDVTGASGFSYSMTSHSFQIEEFRRPEFEVGARADSAGPYVLDEPLTLAVDATYYAGGPLGAAPVDWSVTTSSASYSPPGWDEFSFGEWTPWWYGGDVYDRGYPGGGYMGEFVDGPCCFPSTESEVATYTGTTDADGSHYLQVELAGLEGSQNDLPVTITADAAVTDVNQQQWAASTSVLVHPADLYVGLRGARTFVRQGDPLEVEAIVTDIDGAAVAGRAVTVTASRMEQVYADGSWTEQATDVQTCEITSGTEPSPCSFTTGIGGTYTISSTITDDRGHTSRSEMTRWVSGGDAVPSRVVERQSLTLVPDLVTYEPGQTAEVLVQSPFADGTGLLTVSRGGIISTSTFAVVDGSAVLEIPLADTDIPNLDIAVEVVGATARTADDGTELPDAPQRPAFATGSLTLGVSTASRQLDVAVTPVADAVRPGTDTQVSVAVTDAAGAPVAGAELAVVVVDEAVLALSQYQLQDPMGAFYTQLPNYLTSFYGRDSIVLADPASLAEAGRSSADDGFASADTEAPAATEAAAEAGGAPGDNAAPTALPATDSKTASTVGDGTSAGTIDVRTDFDALAVFEPEVMTDAAGTAVVDVPLPDNLTRYRVMVVAVSGAQRFGSGEANITARLPLMVRPSAPRFANFGDVFDLPVVVQNQTDAAMDVDVVLQTSNLTITGPSGVRVTVPANDRVEVRFPVAAAAAGTARFRVAATSGDAADAATIELPVYTPATAEAFATYGVLDDGVSSQSVLAPTDVIPQFGGLEISTSSTSLQALTDAVLYLTRYEYDSSDAYASRIIAIASLRDVLDAFDADGLPSADEMQATMASDIDALVALQNPDGGFPFWQLDRPSEPYNTVQSTHALVVARDAGETVPPFAIDAALGYLANIESYIPSDWSQEARDSVTAYALFVRDLAGDSDPGAAEELFDRRGEELSLEAIAWLWPVVDDAGIDAEIERIVENRAVDTAGAATFTTDVTDGTWVTLTSDRRTDGLVLDALIAQRPDSDLIPKVVAGLLANRVAGRWDSVQENSFILLALHRYFETYESQTPDFVARVWLGDRFAGEQTFAGRSTDRVHVEVPTADLIAGGDTDLVLSKEGTGRLYYRIGLRTAPADLQLDPLDRGFVVQRTYEAIDDPADVTQDADGTWRIKAGARVRVRLTMVAESARTHAALIDPLPAGFEILNGALAVTADLPTATDDGSATSDGSSSGSVGFGDESWWWWGQWYDHQNLRDDRAEAFAGYLPGGTYDYSYEVRAITPGTFVAPPTRAEEIYTPETFGRGATATVVIA